MTHPLRLGERGIGKLFGVAATRPRWPSAVLPRPDSPTSAVGVRAGGRSGRSPVHLVPGWEGVAGGPPLAAVSWGRPLVGANGRAEVLEAGRCDGLEQAGL